jgi:hypothetical protein
MGDSSIILPGVTIGPNSIVGAGSVVTRDVPPHTVACGNPAKPVSSVNEYIEKISSLSANKRIFGEDYSIDKLDARKRQELIRSIGDTIGFIVALFLGRFKKKSQRETVLVCVYLCGSACPACPVAPADGTGVAPVDGTGVADSKSIFNEN